MEELKGEAQIIHLVHIMTANSGSIYQNMILGHLKAAVAEIKEDAHAEGYQEGLGHGYSNGSQQ